MMWLRRYMFSARSNVWVVQILTIAVWAWFLLKLYGNTQVSRAMAETRALGLPVFLAEVQPSPVAEEENAAPCFIRAWSMLSSKPPDMEFLDGDRQTPTPGPEPDWEQVREYVQTNATALGLVRRGAALSNCRYPLDYAESALDKPTDISGLFRLARLVAAAMHISFEEGNDGAAIEYAADLLALLRSLHDESHIVPLLNQLITARLLWTGTPQLTGSPDVSGKRFRRELLSLESGQLRQALERGLLMEIGIGRTIGYYNLYTRRVRLGSNASERLGWDMIRTVGWVSLPLYAWRCREIAASARLPCRLGIEHSEDVDRELESRLPFFTRWTYGSTAAYQFINKRTCEAETHLALLRLGLEARDHRRPDGSWDLDAPLLNSMEDPFTGELFRRHVEEGALTISSAGLTDTEDDDISLRLE